MRPRLIVVLLLLALSACTLAPRYTRPELPVAADWSQKKADKLVTDETQSAGQIPWQEFFTDTKLQRLIMLALENNRDLRTALLNVERLQARYRVQRAELLPHVNARGTGSGQGIPADLSSTGDQMTVHQYGADLSLSAFELDLFGRVRSLKDTALENFLAEEENRRSIQIALISQVAQSWLTLAADREQLQLVQETLTNQSAMFDIINSRFEAGISSALDLQQAQTSVDRARVDIARYTTLVEQDENLLRLLVGAELPADLEAAALPNNIAAAAVLSTGIGSEILLNRPDILAAEHRLRGANANIGAARAAFFPRITLISSLGTGSDELTGLFKSGNGAWTFAPALTLPIFTAGRNSANLAAAKVDRELAVAGYEKAIQTGFREVADALSRRSTIDAQLAAQQSLTDTTAESYRLTNSRYEQGVDSFLTVLDAQRALYTAQHSLIDTRLTRFNNLVTLYKVLGGGVN